MKIVLLAVGAVLVVLGLHWIGQGTGFLVWPSNPVVDNHIAWAGYGAVAFAAGVTVFLTARRR